MRVRMTRTVEVPRDGRVKRYRIGAAYDLDDRLADAWIAFGVCDPVSDSQEAIGEADSEGSEDSAAESGEGRDAADHDALTEDEG